MHITRITLHQSAGLLRLATDERLEGHCTGITASSAGVERVAPTLLGTNPLDRERTWWAMRDLDQGLPPALLAGIDVALWDLSAKIAGRPIYRHLGGFRNRVPVCRIGTGTGTTSEIVKEAKAAQQAGFKAYRFGMPEDENALVQGNALVRENALVKENALVQLVRETRAAVGPDFPLIFDGRARCVAEEAIRIGRVLDEVDYFYFNRPRPRHDHTGGKQVAGEIDTPTSAEVSSAIEASQVMALQSADHIRTGVCNAGGITDVLKAARCAEAFGAYCHLDGAGISDGFAHVHLAGALRNTPFLEMSGREVAPPFVLNPVQIEDGYVHLADLPGLGMEIDLDAVMDLTSELIEA